MAHTGEPASTAHSGTESAEQVRGVQVIVMLAVLTAIEYAITLAVNSSVLLVLLLTPFALAKAWLIVMYFMHVARAWRGEEEPA